MVKQRRGIAKFAVIYQILMASKLCANKIDVCSFVMKFFAFYNCSTLQRWVKVD